MPSTKDTTDEAAARGLPAPTTQFRRRSWRLFQRELDPLAPPQPLPTRRRAKNL